MCGLEICGVGFCRCINIETHMDLFGMSRVILARLLSMQGCTAIYETSGLGFAAWRNESN